MDTATAASAGCIMRSSPWPRTSCPVWKETSLEDASARDISHDSGAAIEGSSISLPAVRGQRPGPGQMWGRVAGLWPGPSWYISPPCRDLGKTANTIPWRAETPSGQGRGAWEDTQAPFGNPGSRLNSATDGCGAHHIPNHIAFTCGSQGSRTLKKKNTITGNLRHRGSSFKRTFNEALFPNTKSRK